MDNFDLLKKAGEELDMNVSRETYEKFEIYRKLLVEWNKKINLTSITEEKDVYIKHFIDSINIYKIKEIRNLSKVIDVGTGAGFPGIPMKIINPQVNLTLLDPLNKRLIFLKEVLDNIGFGDVELIHGRAEDVSRETSYRDKFDLAVSRAVASFPVISEYCLPFVKKDGFFVAMKGPGIKDELNLRPGILKELSSELVEIKTDITDGYEHNLVIIKKLASTKQTYPRKNTDIKKHAEKYREILKNLK